MHGIPAVLAIDLEDEHFPDDDPGCIHAGKFIAKELSIHLRAAGHSIPKWLDGGCEEDAWVHLESDFGERSYVYTIVFFPRDEHQNGMAVQYELKNQFREIVSDGAARMTGDDPIHMILNEFGKRFDFSALMSREELDAEY